MAVDLHKADRYFSESVFHNDVWMNADSESKQRALNNASVMLTRHYGRRNKIPEEAVFEQALWIMKISEARKQADQGVVSYSVDGISVTLSQVDRSIAPQVLQIVGRRTGQSRSGRTGYIVSTDAREPSGGV